MSRSTNFFRIIAASMIAVVGAGSSSVAQEPTRAAEFDAESLSLDFDTGTTVLKGIRYNEGNTSIFAAEGRRIAAGDATEEWSFTGDVIVALDSAVVRADSARFRFSLGQLVSGELVGEPVELQNPGEELFRGSANRIAYDDAEGVFSATGNASFSFGAQAVRCDWVYDLRQREARGSSSDGQGCTYVRARAAR